MKKMNEKAKRAWMGATLAVPQGTACVYELWEPDPARVVPDDVLEFRMAAGQRVDIHPAR